VRDRSQVGGRFVAWARGAFDGAPVATESRANAVPQAGGGNATRANVARTSAALLAAQVVEAMGPSYAAAAAGSSAARFR
jgi:hypothetical protein